MIYKFNTKEEFDTFNKGLSSGNIYYIEDTDTIVFTTNNVNGKLELIESKRTYPKADEGYFLQKSVPFTQIDSSKEYSEVIIEAKPTKKIWNFITLPCDLKDSEIEEVFGVGTTVHLFYKDTTTVEDNEIVQIERQFAEVHGNIYDSKYGMKAGVCYFINPTFVDSKGQEITSVVMHNKVIKSDLKESINPFKDVETDYICVGALSEEDKIVRYGDIYMHTTTGSYTRYKPKDPTATATLNTGKGSLRCINPKLKDPNVVDNGATTLTGVFKITNIPKVYE